MHDYILQGGSVYAEHQTFTPGFIRVTNGRIAETGPVEQLAPIKHVSVIKIPDRFFVLPGSIDVHIHGAGGADVMDASGHSLQKMASFLPAEGTTSFLATTMTQAMPAIEQALSCFSRFHHEAGMAEIAGIHLEGPFISKKHPGAQPAQAILQPDVSLFQKWLQLSGGNIRLVTLAPEEINGLDLVSFLRKSSITASAGHTDAGFQQMEKAVEAGLTHVTHLFNGMRGMHHREAGAAGSALLNSRIYTELIVDGIHISPPMVRLAFQQKTAERIVLITDSMRAKGLPDGTYELGGQDVTVQAGKAVLQDGTLAGSTLSMQAAIQNMMAFTGCTIRDIVKMAAENPAKQARLFDRKGSIAAGKDADIVIYDENMNVQKTICRGVTAFEKAQAYGLHSRKG